MFFNAFLAMSLRYLLIWENKKLDRKYGKPEPKNLSGKTEVEQQRSADSSVGEENSGPSFRYIL